MSWSFGNNPAESALDRVRVLIGDTNPEEPLLDDEILLWLLSRSDNEWIAASEACRLLFARFAREADLAVGDLSVKLSQRAEHFRTLAETLRSEALSQAGEPVPGVFALPQCAGEAREALFKIGQFSAEGGNP